MEFEFDPKKSWINSKKHGIDFDRAQELWLDAMRVEVAASTVDEPRYVVIGKMTQSIGLQW